MISAFSVTKCLASALRTRAGVLGTCFYFCRASWGRDELTHSALISLHWTMLFFFMFIESILLLKRANLRDTEALGCCWVANRLMLHYIYIVQLYFFSSFPLLGHSHVMGKIARPVRDMSMLLMF